jgi:hypothetical protein
MRRTQHVVTSSCAARNQKMTFRLALGSMPFILLMNRIPISSLIKVRRRQVSCCGILELPFVLILPRHLNIAMKVDYITGIVLEVDFHISHASIFRHK